MVIMNEDDDSVRDVVIIIFDQTVGLSHLSTQFSCMFCTKAIFFQEPSFFETRRTYHQTAFNMALVQRVNASHNSLATQIL